MTITRLSTFRLLSETLENTVLKLWVAVSEHIQIPFPAI